jgi:hypothetical protein
MIFIHGSERNKFGYYQVGDKFCSYSLFEALEYKKTVNYPMEWVFNDEFFSSIDWTKEPTESLEFLYAERARQIREKYDYIILEFSGGSDSHNILNTFVRNNIHLDEILTAHSHDISNVDKHSNVDLMSEIFGAAIPEVQKLLPVDSGTIHRVLDLSDLIKEILFKIEKPNLKFDIVYHYNNYFGPFSMARTETAMHYPYYKSLYNQGKKVCFICGADKPLLRYHNKQWSFHFSNTLDPLIGNFYNNGPMYKEMFYWAPESWKIIAKQAHMIRRYIKENSYIIKNLKTFQEVDNCETLHAMNRSTETPSGLGILDRSVPIAMIKKIIYPWWREDIINCGKMIKRSPMGSVNHWFLDNTFSTPGGQNLYSGLEKLVRMQGHNGPVHTYAKPAILSKPYTF